MHNQNSPIRIISQVGAVLLAFVALGWTAANARRFYESAARAHTNPESIVPQWRSYVFGGQRIGSANAKVVVVMFADYECAACADAYHRLRVLQQSHPQELSIVIRQNPLGSNPNAEMAARAAICAANNQKFAPFNDLLFARADSIGQLPWSRFPLCQYE